MDLTDQFNSRTTTNTLKPVPTHNKTSGKSGMHISFNQDCRSLADSQQVFNKAVDSLLQFQKQSVSTGLGGFSEHRVQTSLVSQMNKLN